MTRQELKALIKLCGGKKRVIEVEAGMRLIAEMGNVLRGKTKEGGNE